MNWGPRANSAESLFGELAQGGLTVLSDVALARNSSLAARNYLPLKRKKPNSLSRACFLMGACGAGLPRGWPSSGVRGTPRY